MDLDAYLDRIGYRGSVRPDEDTLTALHEAHLASIPYENLDIQLGHEKTVDEARFEDRLVGERRGGWCYEMNGLFSMALRQIGFRVERLGGAIARELQGDKGLGHHMVLLVDLGRPFVADVGLGDGPVHPFPLEARRWSDSGFEYAVERLDGGWWRVRNHPNGLAPSFDFQETARDLAWYRPFSAHLQTMDGSPFLNLAMVFRRERERVRALRDSTFIEVVGPEKTERRVEDGDEWVRLVREMVDPIDAEAAARLWTRVRERVAARDAAKSGAEGDA